jgi:hypothetical protein
MRSSQDSGRMLGAWLALVWTSLAAGCASLTTQELGTLPQPGTDPSVATQSAVPNNGSITVEIRPEKSGKPELRQLPLQSPMYVQQALEATGVIKRFRGMNVELIRMAGDKRQKMDSKYVRAGRRVDPGYDYALHPGDHLIVTEDSTTVLDEMFHALTGPIGKAVGK